MSPIINLNSYSTEEIKSFIVNTPLIELKEIATSVREKKFGNKIQLCSIINAKSGVCTENCAYCAQSSHHKTNIEKYPLLKVEQILKNALFAEEKGISNLGIVTSGNTLSGKELDAICRIIEFTIKNTNIKICASLGKLTCTQLKRLKSAGLDRYHHNLETSKSYFPKVCTSHNFEDRIETLISAKEAGLKMCSGGIFGIGEEWEDRIDLAYSLKKLQVDNIPINFLTPVSGTPLEKRSILSAVEALRIIALYRLILPENTIRICGGRANVFTKERQSEIYSAGANAIITGDYLTTGGITPDTDKKTIATAGLTLECVGVHLSSCRS